MPAAVESKLKLFEPGVAAHEIKPLEDMVHKLNEQFGNVDAVLEGRELDIYMRCSKTKQCLCKIVLIKSRKTGDWVVNGIHPGVPLYAFLRNELKLKFSEDRAF